MKPDTRETARSSAASSSLRVVAEPADDFSFPNVAFLNAAFLAIGVLVMHIVTNFLTPYGFHRDEFLYLAMGEHLRLWRMDFPPFIAIVARASHELFGASLPGIRFAPAVAHAGMVFAAAFATAVFGGRRSAQTLAALGIALCPFFLRAGAMLQPVVFDQLWWTLALLGLALRIRDDDPKHWTGTGLFLGLAALTKFSVAFLAAGFVAALLLTHLRNDLKTKWPWIALIMATIIGHPSITGQISLGWPLVGQFSDLQSEQLSRVSPLDFLAGQLSAGPVLFLAIGGLVWLWSAPRAALGAEDLSDYKGPGSLNFKGPGSLKNGTADYRPIAVVTATAFLILLFMRGKAYYIAPIYPILTAAGAAALDRLAVRISPKRPSKVLAVAAAVVALYGMITLPFGLPLLSPPDMSRAAALIGKQNKSNTGETLPLPQDYADMLGWQELANMTALVWRALPPADTANAILIGTNYGRAGALDLYGPELGLPKAVSAAGSYWFFGPGAKSGAVAVVPTDQIETLKQFYSLCTIQAQTNNPWGVPEEQSVQVYVCRGAKASIQDVWAGLGGRN